MKPIFRHYNDMKLHKLITLKVSIQEVEAVQNHMHAKYYNN